MCTNRLQFGKGQAGRGLSTAPLRTAVGQGGDRAPDRAREGAVSPLGRLECGCWPLTTGTVRKRRKQGGKQRGLLAPGPSGHLQPKAVSNGNTRSKPGSPGLQAEPGVVPGARLLTGTLWLQVWAQDTGAGPSESGGKKEQDSVEPRQAARSRSAGRDPRAAPTAAGSECHPGVATPSSLRRGTPPGAGMGPRGGTLGKPG